MTGVQTCALPIWKLSHQALRILKDIVNAKKEFKKGKSNSHKIDEARKNAMILINDLIEYSQRKDLIALEKSRIRLKYKEDGKEKSAELFISNEKSFLVNGKVIKKITNKIQDSNIKEFTESVAKQKSKQKYHILPPSSYAQLIYVIMGFSIPF